MLYINRDCFWHFSCPNVTSQPRRAKSLWVLFFLVLQISVAVCWEYDGRWVLFFLVLQISVAVTQVHLLKEALNAGGHGFTQRVHIYSPHYPSNPYLGTVLIDPGNSGPNLITDEVLQYLEECPTGPSTTIKVFDGDERIIGGEVSLSFSGPGSQSRYHRELFRQVPHIDGYDMILNHDFYLKVFPEKMPGPLMIRSGNGKETQGEEASRREGERRREERARQQEAQRREQRRANEAERQAQQAKYCGSSNANSGA